MVDCIDRYSTVAIRPWPLIQSIFFESQSFILTESFPTCTKRLWQSSFSCSVVAKVPRKSARWCGQRAFLHEQNICSYTPIRKMLSLRQRCPHLWCTVLCCASRLLHARSSTSIPRTFEDGLEVLLTCNAHSLYCQDGKAHQWARWLNGCHIITQLGGD